MKSNGYYNSDTDRQRVWAISPECIATVVNPFCMALIPSDGIERDPPPGPAVTELRKFMENPPDGELTLSFGELVCWVERRAGEWVESQDCDLCGGSCGRRRGDPQRVLGVVFDRQWVREVMQWLFEFRIDLASPVRLRTVDVTGDRTVPGHVLVMTCGDWTGIVMSCTRESKYGDDPLGEA